MGNYCQIFQDTIAVSGRANKVKKAGMTSASAYHKAKAYKELQRDFEAAALSINPAVIGNSGAAAKMGGLGVLVYTNVLHNGAGATAAHTSGAPTVANTAGTNRAFTEALLKTAIQNTYVASGKVPPMVMLSPSHKSTFSGFAGIAVNRYQVGKKEQGRIVGGADVYMSDFGELEIVPNYVMAGANFAYGLNNDYIDAVYLRPFQSDELGKSGDSKKEQVLVDSTLRVTSELAQFAIKDLTP